MNDIQRELLDILETLDERRQYELLSDARELQHESKMTPQEFLAYAEASSTALKKKYGEAIRFNSLDVLDQLREERDDELER